MGVTYITAGGEIVADRSDTYYSKGEVSMKFRFLALCAAVAGLMLAGCGEQSPTKADLNSGAAKEIALPETDPTLGPDGRVPEVAAKVAVVTRPAARPLLPAMNSGSLPDILRVRLLSMAQHRQAPATASEASEP